MNMPPYFTLIVITVPLLSTIFLVIIYNKFAKNRNMVKDAWSNIEVFLKKRHNLIPNLVNTVKGYAAHEKNTLEKVVQARSYAASVPSGDINTRIAAENQLTQTLRSILMLQEAYPDLKANANFLDLQQQLAQLEGELERSRRYYNATVRQNNTFGESVPGVLFAHWFKHQHFEFYQADESDKTTPTVDFNT